MVETMEIPLLWSFFNGPLDRSFWGMTFGGYFGFAIWAHSFANGASYGWSFGCFCGIGLDWIRERIS
jgi:hypothetical protein